MLQSSDKESWIRRGGRVKVGVRKSALDGWYKRGGGVLLGDPIDITEGISGYGGKPAEAKRSCVFARPYGKTQPF